MEDLKSETQEVQGYPFFEYDPLFFPIAKSVREFVANYDSTQRNFPKDRCMYESPSTRQEDLYVRVREMVSYVVGISDHSPDEGNTNLLDIITGFNLGHPPGSIKLAVMRAQVFARRSEYQNTTHIVDTIPLSIVYAWMSQSLESIQEVFQKYKK